MSRRTIVSFFSMAAIIACGAALTARAYSINGPQPTTPSIPSIGSFDLNTLFGPFENFFHSINSVGNGGTTVPLTMPSTPQSQTVTGGFQHMLDQFDAWLYGIAGFHVLGLFTAILNVFSWLLGIVKGGVDWLLGWIH